ncbi:probable asparagine--tRNA ligase, mitochondrial isoform X2 [Mya arenaria]|uniref:probable asparagine--tRNA ligase, mitochondrial isoform X2 n=1 Tax=Mya arenaria TaxID=6604 RepID=UPI0022E5C1A6|nr:probable asparagine--tRNA ligase, mitochondrial isoform X2 [Mya arenaria]
MHKWTKSNKQQTHTQHLLRTGNMSASIALTILRLKNFQVILHRSYSVRRTVKEILNGWLRHVRKQKNVVFCSLYDGSTDKHLQVVADPQICHEELCTGCSVEVGGSLVPSQGRGQAVELQADHLSIVGPCDNEVYPIKPKTEYTADQLRAFPHLRARTILHQKLLRIRSTASMAVHKYFLDNHFLFVHTPITTSVDCEGAGETFSIKTGEELKPGAGGSDGPGHFFNSPTYLTVSGQLHLEVITGSFLKAYSFGPTFRAEKSPGRHHLAEFYMIEAEVAFTQSMECILQVMEGLVKSMTQSVLDSHEGEVEDLWKHSQVSDQSDIVNRLLNKTYIRMSYSDAIKILENKKDNFKESPKWGCDLSKEHEKFLVKHCGNVPVFVTDFPTEIKPFYCRQNEDHATVGAVDLLVPGVGELCGGSLREERHDILRPSLDNLGLTQPYHWYLELRQFGSVPHGGFGLGFERYLQCLLGIHNIKDTIPFPRWVQHCPL